MNRRDHSISDRAAFSQVGDHLDRPTTISLNIDDVRRHTVSPRLPLSGRSAGGMIRQVTSAPTQNPLLMRMSSVTDITSPVYSRCTDPSVPEFFRDRIRGTRERVEPTGRDDAERFSPWELPDDRGPRVTTFLEAPRCRCLAEATARVPPGLWLISALRQNDVGRGAQILRDPVWFGLCFIRPVASLDQNRAQAGVAPARDVDRLVAD
jgi:hypothetical protein